MEYHIWQITCRMVELAYNFRDGWTEDQRILFNNLAWRRLILLEETVSGKQCVITAHETTHVAEDVLRFSIPDNYWCWHFERAVKRYHKIVLHNLYFLLLSKETIY